jgi:hypothetical protein
MYWLLAMNGIGSPSISAQYRGRSISCEAFDIQVRRVEIDPAMTLFDLHAAHLNVEGLAGN